MKISFVLPTLSTSGGVKVATLYARKLSEAGHTVTIVSPPPPKISPLQKLRRWARPREAASPAAWEFVRIAPPMKLVVLDRQRAVNDGDVPDGDAVVATWWETAEWVAKLSDDKGKKIYFIQGHEIFPYLPVERSSATYRLPLHHIVVSRWLKEKMQNEYGRSDAIVVPNSVDRSIFFSHNRKKQMVPTVGTLYSTAAMKRTDLVVEALVAIQARIKNLRVLMFGSDHPSGALSRLSNVEFLFRPQPQQIRELYSACDVWVSASQSEGFNLTAMEAMACGTPVVATPTGWPFDAVRSFENGVLIDFDNQVQLEKAVTWLLETDAATWLQISANANVSASIGSWDESYRLFEEAIANAVRS